MSSSPSLPAWHTLLSLLHTPQHHYDAVGASADSQAQFAHASPLIALPLSPQPLNTSAGAQEVASATLSTITDGLRYYHNASVHADVSGGGDSDIQRAMQSLVPALWQSFAVILLGYACVKLEVVKQSHKQVKIC